MLSLTELVRDQTEDRIVTSGIVQELLENNQSVKFVRSGIYPNLGSCVDLISQACRSAMHRKEIRIILPSLDNEDMKFRAAVAGHNPQDVIRRLASWHEMIVTLSKELPDHLIELHTTNQPHRYHAIFSESEGFVGIGWHSKASLGETCFDIRRDSQTRKWVLGNLLQDFDWLWKHSDPYSAGDNKRKVAHAKQVGVDPILLEFGRAVESVVRILRFIEHHFPDANGKGATGDQVGAHTGSNGSDANKRLKLMEQAGMLCRADNRGPDLSGRLLTPFGQRVLLQYDEAHAIARPEL